MNGAIIKFKMNIYFRIFKIFAPVFIFIICSGPANAAALYFNLSKNEFRAGDTFIAKMKIDTQGECINTVKADIKFSDVLEAVDFVKSDSILVFWVEDPRIDNNTDKISFAGGIPGGYCGKISDDSGSGNIIGKIVFKAKDVGQEGAKSEPAELEILNTSEILLNDGLGTKANLTVRNANLDILNKEGSASDAWKDEKENDKIPPEIFNIGIEQDPGIFDGKYFAVFSTLDKQTGVDHYEVQENGRGWERADSPYLLKKQDIKTPIKVKAVDKAGNERIEEINYERSEFKTVARSIPDLLYILAVGIIAGLWIIIRLIIKIKGGKNHK